MQEHFVVAVVVVISVALSVCCLRGRFKKFKVNVSKFDMLGIENLTPHVATNWARVFFLGEWYARSDND